MANFVQRNTTATYVDGSGIVRTAPANALRDQHFINGKLQPALIEPAATNLALWSEDWTNATYTKSNVSVGSNLATAPDGTLTADILTRTSTTLNAQVTQPTGVLGAGNTFTLSVFAKANTIGNQLGIRLQSTYPVRADAVFDLSTGTIKGTNANTYTNVKASMIPLGNGWYRCILTSTVPNNNTSFILIVPTDPSLSVGSFEGFSGVLDDIQIWGTMLEVGSVATSYIPTTNAAVTRAADYFAAAGPASFTGGWYLAEKGHVAPPAEPKPKARKPSQAERHAARVAREFAARQAELKAAEDRRIENARKLWGASETTQPTYLRIPKAVKSSRGPKILRLPRSK